MKRGDLIHEDHHVLRYINNKHVMRDEAGERVRDEEGNLIIFPQAFELKVDEDEEYLSINWCEYFQNECIEINVQQCISSFKEFFFKKPSRSKQPSVFALGNVKKIHATIKELKSNKIRIAYWPDTKRPKHNPSHSAIYHLNQDLGFLQDFQLQAFGRLIEVTE